MKSAPVWFAVALATPFFAPTAAHAETRGDRTLTLGWLVEHAEAVAVATLTANRPQGASGVHELTLVVEDPIRGPLARSALQSGDT